MKTCSSCKELKPLNEFAIKTAQRRQSKCKTCFKLFAKEYRKTNNHEINVRRRESYKINKPDISARKRRYYQKNRTKIIKKASDYCLHKLRTDLQFRLRHRIRDRFKKALVGNYKNGSAIMALGCSIEFLKSYLESKFTPGMTWENYGRYGWHIDHIIPLSKFDLTDPKDIVVACHYTNLQPLWASDNLKKSNK